MSWLFLLATLVSGLTFALPANALVILSVEVGGSSELSMQAPGTNLTVEITMQTTGLASAYQFAARVSGATASNPVHTPPLGTFPGALPTCGTGPSPLCGSFTSIAFPAIAAGTYAIATFEIQTIGAVTVSIEPVVDFVGDPEDHVAPGDTAVLNHLVTIPEPATSSLLAFGLAWLGLSFQNEPGDYYARSTGRGRAR